MPLFCKETQIITWSSKKERFSLHIKGPVHVLFMVSSGLWLLLILLSEITFVTSVLIVVQQENAVDIYTLCLAHRASHRAQEDLRHHQWYLTDCFVCCLFCLVDRCGLQSVYIKWFRRFTRYYHTCIINTISIFHF